MRFLTIAFTLGALLVAATPSPTVAQIARPENSVLRVKKGKELVAPFTIITPKGHDYLVRLINEKTRNEEMAIFVRASSSYKVKAPLGTFRIIGVYGSTWYGGSNYFGDDSQFFKTRKTDGNEITTFYKNGNTVWGAIIEFQLVRDGNLNTPSISRAEYEKSANAN